MKSVRGAQGGYLLKGTPAEYTVGMILRQVEGSLVPAACAEEGTTLCDRANICKTAGLWRRVNDAVNSVIDTTTLQDLLEEQ